jgi:hypothetical protein
VLEVQIKMKSHRKHATRFLLAFLAFCGSIHFASISLSQIVHEVKKKLFGSHFLWTL